MQTIQLNLQRNKTYGHRQAWWTLVKNTFPGLGLLAMYEQKSTKAKKVVDSRYAVIELPPTWGRRFRITKNTGEVYHTLVAKQSSQSRCSCTGFEQYGKCRHLEAMTDILKRQLMPDRFNILGEELDDTQKEKPSPETSRKGAEIILADSKKLPKKKPANRSR